MQEWIRHYKHLWYNPIAPFITEVRTTEIDVDSIDMIKLKTSKSRKATGPDNINSELFKYINDLPPKKIYYTFLICIGENV